MQDDKQQKKKTHLVLGSVQRDHKRAFRAFRRPVLFTVRTTAEVVHGLAVCVKQFDDLATSHVTKPGTFGDRLQ